MPQEKAPTPQSVEEYIAQFPPDRQAILEQVRAVIRETAPQATEKISWQMPTYHQGENLVHFAMQKNHLGFYPGGEATGVFAEQLAGYKTSKGSIQFPLANPIPLELIREITAWRVQKVEEKEK